MTELTNAIYQVRWAIVIVVTTALACIVSSLIGLGSVAIWPVTCLFLIFLKFYELGLVCFVLSFAYQAPVFIAPQFGLSAFLRLDELIFLAIFPVWLLKGAGAESKKPSRAPLRKPLLFYAVIAFMSLVPRYGDLGSTFFYNTATGLLGLSFLIFKLLEVILGYWMLTDSNITQGTRQNMFWCLPLIAGFAVMLGLVSGLSLVPNSPFVSEAYDPTAYSTRFALYGNTSSWGVLLMIYFFVLFYAFLIAGTWIRRLFLAILLTFCLFCVLVSGTKTAMLGIVIGLSIFFLNSSVKLNQKLLSLFAILVFSSLGALLVERFATLEQKDNIYREMENAYRGTGAEGSDKIATETSLSGRLEALGRFGGAVEEEPSLLIIGRGWHRRSAYESGAALHNDLLQATHDMGIPGAFFVVWMYFAMYRQFTIFQMKFLKSDKLNLLTSVMQILAILFVISSFTGENLTFYAGGIDVQFPLIVMLMAVVWQYLDNACEVTQHAFL